MTVPRAVFVVWAGVGAVLAAATIVRLAFLAGRDDDEANHLRARLATWWATATAVFSATLLGSAGIILMVAAATWQALREYCRLVPEPALRGALGRWLLAAVPGVHATLGVGWSEGFDLFPVAAILVLTARLVARGEPDRFLTIAGAAAWPALAIVFGLAHAAALAAFPERIGAENVAGGLAAFTFLIVVTEGSDISQALVGRRFGRRRLAPHLSPGKTWEGLAGGLASAALLGATLGPALTPLGAPDSWTGAASLAGAALGLLLAVAGVFGDLSVSGLKRSAGVKDCGELLPGHGGMLDRVDSLTFTAPVLFHALRLAAG